MVTQAEFVEALGEHLIGEAIMTPDGQHYGMVGVDAELPHCLIVKLETGEEFRLHIVVHTPVAEGTVEFGADPELDRLLQAEQEEEINAAEHAFIQKADKLHDTPE